MLNRCLVSLVLIGLMGTAVFAAQEFPYAKELMGQLHLGLGEQQVAKLIPGRPSRGPEEKWGADGAYHQEWQYPKAGISLGMVAEKKGGPKSVGSITIASPCTLRTQRGVGIGSTEAEVTKAYGPFRNAEESAPGERIVAGSIFGGVIFTLKQGKVSEIFIGAAAE
jgi:hypothetical protein